MEDASGGMTAGILWELKNMEDKEEPNEAEIMWLRAKNTPEGAELLESLKESLKENEVKRVFFELSSLSGEEEKAGEVCAFPVGDHTPAV